MTAPSRQLHLALNLPEGRPLLPVRVAMTLLDRHEDDVLALIDNGRLSWAWDVAGKVNRKREIRIWRESLLRLLDIPSEIDHDDEQQVLDSIFPHGRDELRGPELQRMLNVGQDHIRHLVEGGLVQALNQTAPGPFGYARISRASIIDFLRSRRVL